jgi:hypothetical protein
MSLGAFDIPEGVARVRSLIKPKKGKSKLIELKI